jgi:integrase/recombinase XerD
MGKVSDGTKQSTKKLRFTLLAAFFNYIKNSVDPDLQNPCDNAALRKLFRAGKTIQFEILEKDVVDEIIFRTPNPRNRLLFELMARAGMRVGEVLKLRPKDIEDRKAIIRAPKRGKEAEAAFLPHKVADRLRKYIGDKGFRPEDRIFPITRRFKSSRQRTATKPSCDKVRGLQVFLSERFWAEMRNSLKCDDSEAQDEIGVLFFAGEELR